MKTKVATVLSLCLPMFFLEGFSSLQDRVTELEKEMKEVGTTNTEGTFGASFVSTRSGGEKKWFLYADPLYWHAKVGGTQFAITVSDMTSVRDLFVLSENDNMKELDFGWDWGFRVGLGRRLKYDNWDLSAEYTFFDTHDSSSIHKDLPSSIRPIRVGDNFLADLAKSSFDLGYNTVHLQLSRTHFLSKRLSVEPFVSLKSAWITLKQMAQYQIKFPTEDGGEPSRFNGKIIKTQDRSHVWGLGPRIGLNGALALGDHFSLVGKTHGALLYANTSVVHQFKGNADASNAGSDYNERLKGKAHSFLPTARLYLGLEWSKQFFNETKKVTLGGGYDVEYYWRGNKIQLKSDVSNADRIESRRIQADSVSEDVSFYGISLHAQLDF